MDFQTISLRLKESWTVLEKMIREGYNFGGEQSGHIIFLDYNTTGDGLITALQVVSLMKKSGKPLEALASCMTVYPQVLVNVKVSQRKELKEIRGFSDHLSSIEGKLDGNGRVLVRYSGTEPLIRIMLEGEDRGVIHSMANELAETIRKGF